MRLAALLTSLDEHELDRLAREHVRTDEPLPTPQLCGYLEGAIRSYRFVNDFVFNRQPPTFAILTLLLDAPSHTLPVDGFERRVAEETERIARLIEGGDLLARDQGLHLYRRALYEARRSDLDLNSSEANLLAVLRRETGVAQVEHFLLEHHADLREFWDREDGFAHELHALRSAGLLFVRGEAVVIPEEVAPIVRHTLGIDMPTESARRLLTHLSNNELYGALEAAGSRTSGTKEARLERVILEHIQPRVFLKGVALSTLRAICRETEASVSGNKDELIERIIAHFGENRDQREEEPPAPPVREERRLGRDQFEALFSALLHQELTDILRRLPDLRQSGTKEIRIRTLWEAHLSEKTLLGQLMNRQLEDVLARVALRLGGSKENRIDRIVGHYSSSSPTSVAVTLDEPSPLGQWSTGPVDSAIIDNQELFRQKASSPQTLLQPWLEQLLDGQGLIRCYATEDANPTKQLKNKLSQAAAARDGLLVLLLADETSFERACDALVGRWMGNDEWPKSVASVALAHPLGNPVITTVVERGKFQWAIRIREHLFPAVRSVLVAGTSANRCQSCSGDLPAAARFCPTCGRAATSSGQIT
jgi:hypothetical protein